jgi:phosphate transport system substrate-binding protein
MNIKAYWKAQFKVTNALFLLFSLFLLTDCSQEKAGETARSGKMTMAVDRQLGDAAGNQIKMFTAYYPDTKITLLGSGSGKTVKHLLDRSARAALISGDPDAVEDSLFATMPQRLRREPVARDAIVCIVNRTSPISKLSLKELGALFSGKESSGVTALVTADDYRLLSMFAAATGIGKKEITARGCISEGELIKRVSSDRNAIGLLFRSSLDGVLNDRVGENEIRIIHIAKEEGSTPYPPTQQNIFEGLYPLVTTVYYVYYAGDALAAGFGSWLSTSGQKTFEKSSLAPYRAFQRTIILK